MPPSPTSHSDIVATIKIWLEKAVIGLNLCPFAKSVYVRDQIRFVVSDAATTEELATTLIDELSLLHAAEAAHIDTTLLIHPNVLQDFADYNNFLGVADMIVEKMGLTGELQLASFHPDYQFEGTTEDDITNYTNRAPYPILHLLREKSLETALARYPDPDSIYRNNMEILRKLGLSGWKALDIPKGK